VDFDDIGLGIAVLERLCRLLKLGRHPDSGLMSLHLKQLIDLDPGARTECTELLVELLMLLGTLLISGAR